MRMAQWLNSLACLLLLTCCGTLWSKEPSVWLSDYDEAKKLAQRDGKPIFVVFRCEH